MRILTPARLLFSRNGVRVVQMSVVNGNYGSFSLHSINFSNVAKSRFSSSSIQKDNDKDEKDGDFHADSETKETFSSLKEMLLKSAREVNSAENVIAENNPFQPQQQQQQPPQQQQHLRLPPQPRFGNPDIGGFQPPPPPPPPKNEKTKTTTSSWRTLSAAGYGFIILVGGVAVGLISFPFLDTILFPVALAAALKKHSKVNKQAIQTNDEDIVSASDSLASLLASSSSSSSAGLPLIVVSGDSCSGKSVIVRRALEQGEGEGGKKRPAMVISCRGFTSDATILYSMLAQLTAPLGFIGTMIVGYIKGVNAFADITVSNNSHEHTTFIFFCQFLDNLRSGYLRLRGSKSSSSSPPVLVWDDFDVLLRSAKDDENVKRILRVITQFSLALTRATDMGGGGLGAVVFVVNNEGILPKKQQEGGGGGEEKKILTLDDTVFGREMPDIASRASFLYVPNSRRRESEEIATTQLSLKQLMEEKGAAPFLLWKMLKGCNSSSLNSLVSLFPSSSHGELMESVSSLVERGFVRIVFGSPLPFSSSSPAVTSPLPLLVKGGEVGLEATCETIDLFEQMMKNNNNINNKSFFSSPSSSPPSPPLFPFSFSFNILDKKKNLVYHRVTIEISSPDMSHDMEIAIKKKIKAVSGR